MVTQALAIARNAFVEGLRQPVVLLLVLGSGVLQMLTTANTGFAMVLEESGEVEGDNKLLLDIGLSTVFVCGTILAAFIATASLSREIERKTVLTVVSKPVPRAIVVLGKYLGNSAAILLAVVGMLMFLLICLRHGVLSTAADDVDWAAVLAGVGSVALAGLIAAWCNFFYGWNFPQTALVFLVPLLVVGYALCLKVGKLWQVQDWGHDFKPQVTLACGALAMGMLVLTAIATAASARLGQVMTIFLCLGVFVASLLTDYFIGRHTYSNTPVGVISTAEPTAPQMAGFKQSGDTYAIELSQTPSAAMPPGSSFYYGPNANGFDLAVPTFPGFSGNIADSTQLLGPLTPGRVLITKQTGRTLTVQNVGGTALAVARPPVPGDMVFLQPTHANYAVLGLWGALPNMHYFWLLDAVSQNEPIPLYHLGLILLYSVTQIGVFLSLAIILFERRDVG